MQSGAEIEVLSASSYPKLDPILPQHHTFEINFDEEEDDDDDSDASAEFPRAASYTNLPALLEPSPGGLPRTFSENNLALSSEPLKNKSAPIYRPNKTLLRRVSERSVDSVKQTTTSEPTTIDPENTNHNLVAPTANGIKPITRAETDQSRSPGKSVSGSLKGLVKKSWMSPSRSPSPNKARKRSPVKQESQTIPPADAADNKSKWKRSKSRPSSPKREKSSESRTSDDPLPPTRKGTILSKGRRPLSTILTGSRSESEPTIRKVPSLRSLKGNASFERLSSPVVPTVNVVPPVPHSISPDKVLKAFKDTSKQKDPLWSAFRSLEGDYQKFQSKSSALKVNVIRSSLLIFLSKYASHPSNSSVRVEDLDRRVMILNKWWTGLMEILNSRSHQASIFGNDRPVFLEAVTGIMTRPEWRFPPLPTRPSSPADNSTQSRPSMPDRSDASFESNGSDFLTESVYHNVRNLFAQNLLSQMVFVVEKMSMKTAPASLVNFCGKTCAYAFFFCPSVADILTRLWALPPETLRRVLSESGISRRSNLRDESQEIASLFPTPVRSLTFESHAKLCRTLRQPPQLPLGAASVKWFGPWINRWTGRESDLFFAFTKHFHMLVAGFLPHDFNLRDRSCVPGLLLVHAQILTVLEATLYRQAQAGQEKLDQFQMALFDEIEGPDVPASTMPVTAANAVRSMAENRLIMLLRDLLDDKSPEQHFVRRLYSISFDRLLMAAARRMSLFDNNACVILCDFMEEVLILTYRYQDEGREVDHFDWPFWLEVFQKMMNSHNTLTEIRVFALVYNMWEILNENAVRQRQLCLGWLLNPTFFNKHFNHWCPMVRQYYYRLLCWRVCRLEEDDTPESLEIVEVLHERLTEVWAQYLFLSQEAEYRHINQPSTAPCSPAPGRRIVIIRTDDQALSTGYFMSFDSVGARKRMNQSTSYRRHSSMLNGLPEPETVAPKQKRWSMLKNMVPFNSSGPGNSRPGEVTPPETPDNSEARPNSTLRRGSNGAEVGASSPPHQAYSFKFSLEWLDRHLWPSKNRHLSLPKLPQSAQAAIETTLGPQISSPVQPMEPPPAYRASAKYSGRALAEWAQVVSECNGFFDRRRDEGVPTDRMVETPILSVESFRMFG